MRPFRTCLWAFLFVASAIRTPAHAQSQDAAKALNLFQQFGTPRAGPRNGARHSCRTRRCVLGNALSGNVAGNGVANAAQAGDWISSLSQAGELIDEPKEIEIGRHLAASPGFDPYGLVAVLQQLCTVAPDNTAFTLTMSTHPPAQLRMDQVELAKGNRLDAFSGKTAVTVGQRMEQLAAAEQRKKSATTVAHANKAAPAPASKPAAKPSAKPAATVKADVLRDTWRHAIRAKMRTAPQGAVASCRNFNVSLRRRSPRAFSSQRAATR